MPPDLLHALGEVWSTAPVGSAADAAGASVSAALGQLAASVVQPVLVLPRPRQERKDSAFHRDVKLAAGVIQRLRSGDSSVSAGDWQRTQRVLAGMLPAPSPEVWRATRASRVQLQDDVSAQLYASRAAAAAVVDAAMGVSAAVTAWRRLAGLSIYTGAVLGDDEADDDDARREAEASEDECELTDFDSDSGKEDGRGASQAVSAVTAGSTAPRLGTIGYQCKGSRAFTGSAAARPVAAQRNTPFGNPYRMGTSGTDGRLRQRVVAAYRELLRGGAAADLVQIATEHRLLQFIDRQFDPRTPSPRFTGVMRESAVAGLVDEVVDGKHLRLVCTCQPDAACHTDVLAGEVLARAAERVSGASTSGAGSGSTDDGDDSDSGGGSDAGGGGSEAQAGDAVVDAATPGELVHSDELLQATPATRADGDVRDAHEKHASDSEGVRRLRGVDVAQQLGLIAYLRLQHGDRRETPPGLARAIASDPRLFHGSDAAEVERRRRRQRQGGQIAGTARMNLRAAFGAAGSGGGSSGSRGAAEGDSGSDDGSEGDGRGSGDAEASGGRSDRVLAADIGVVGQVTACEGDDDMMVCETGGAEGDMLDDTERWGDNDGAVGDRTAEDSMSAGREAGAAEVSAAAGGEAAGAGDIMEPGSGGTAAGRGVGCDVSGDVEGNMEGHGELEVLDSDMHEGITTATASASDSAATSTAAAAVPTVTAASTPTSARRRQKRKMQRERSSLGTSGDWRNYKRTGDVGMDE